MINSNLKSVQINNYIIDKKEKKVHTYYRIELVTKYNRQICVDKRYKEFEALHSETKIEYSILKKLFSI
ncbi:hypothetical protein BpHYR1_039767 [Brachionus plicatilis]|uniref:PX domain-containing protein n=1 Tax=Brachionus plicatilis TaxID=10195 RepID=A0A3M7SKZ4_BRAPC|nr:hypothetical protein BpHYR1_039767 [Brachionus plicatilis]